MPYQADTTEDHIRDDRARTGSAEPDSFVPSKRLVDQRATTQGTETRWLLQERQRAASLVLVVGFGLFFVRSLILHWDKLESLAVLFHGIMLGLLLLSLAALSNRWKRPRSASFGRSRLRSFGLIIVFFMAAQYVLMLRGVRDERPDPGAGGGQEQRALDAGDDLHLRDLHPQHTGVRAAKLIVPMALAPMAVPWILGLVHPEFYEVAIRAANLEKISEDGLFLLLVPSRRSSARTPSTRLRIEAYEARLLEPVSPGPKAGRRRDGRGLPGRASVAQACRARSS